MKNATKTFLLLTIVFLISVLFRLPNLNRPLSKHHEFCTALSLRIMQIWNEEGALKNHFCPNLNYANPSDKFIQNHSTGIQDSKGNYYYVSHPPFGYMLPYFLFKIFYLYPDVVPLQTFNLLFHFISAFLVYLIICMILKKNFQDSLVMPAFAGFLVYLFTPATLWFHSNVYMSDIFIQNFWVLSVFIFLKIIFENRITSLKWLACLWLVTFLMIFTSLVGIIYIFTFGLWCVYQQKNSKKYLGVIFTLFFSTISALILTAFLYSNINGIQNFLTELSGRFMTRGGYSSGGDFFITIFDGWMRIFFNYVTGYLPFLILTVVLFFLIYKDGAKLKLIDERQKNFLFITALPLLLFPFILLNYCGHDFAELNASLFFSGSIGCLYNKLHNRRKALKLMFAFSIMFSLVQYYGINRPGDKSWKGDEYVHYKNAGLFIHNNSEQEEVVTLHGEEIIEPQLIFYAHRNVRAVENIDDAKKFLQKTNRPKGIYFEIGNHDSINITRIKME